MLKKLRLFFVLILICSCQIISAQEKPVKKRDSLRGYRSIEAYSKKRGFTKFLHKLIFKPVDSKKQLEETGKGLLKDLLKKKPKDTTQKQ